MELLTHHGSYNSYHVDSISTTSNRHFTFVQQKQTGL